MPVKSTTPTKAEIAKVKAKEKAKAKAKAKAKKNEKVSSGNNSVSKNSLGKLPSLKGHHTNIEKQLAAHKNGKYIATYAEDAFKLALLGLGLDKMADFFNVTTGVIQTWRKKFPAFDLAISEGGPLADSVIAKSMYQTAQGYDYYEDVTHVINNKIVTTRVLKHAKPSVPAQTFWLKQRQRDVWAEDNKAIEIVTQDINGNKTGIKITYD